MRKILYKTPGAMLMPGPDGMPVRKVIGVTTEVPFSEENLQRAEATALSGSLQVREHPDTDPPESAAAGTPDVAEALHRLLMKDRSSDTVYELYVDNGKLMMEVM